MPNISQRAIAHTAIASFLIAGCAAGAAVLDGQTIINSGQRTGDRDRMEARQEIHESVELASGAQVRVQTVAGPVSIETTNGNKAEIHVVRMARTQQELDCYRVDIQSSRENLSIRQVQFSNRAGCDRIEARQEVRLRLPKSANVHLSSIAGNVEVGAMEGNVRLNGIAGRAELAEVRSADISGIAGTLSLKFASQGPWDASVSGIAGPVELAFRRGVDADLRVSGLMGRLSSLSPDIQVVDGDPHRVRVGSGGPRLALSGIVGSVQVRRY